MKSFAIFFCVVVIFCVSRAKVFDKCEIVTKMSKHGVPWSKIPTFVCLIKWESGFDSGKLDYKTGKHGLFQINEKVWCSPYTNPGRECNTTCSDFRDDHIMDDINCALKIFSDTLDLSGIGFDAWTSYWDHCAADDNMDYVEGCKTD
ncbi:lysozyme-like [Diabrotica virgifera virgifera]|uniref:lysozyme n=1 Tax=Diabrotica virgifera virgifera TaxID=50390 RepID=A0A6P7G4X5_DIAVI|nr:lysozyme-like [Diabrotica virgifera virgifera]